MHELSIAAEMIRQLEGLAEEHGAVRIVEVEVVCGLMRQVVPEALQTAFEVVSAGTVAAGARLKISEQSLTARCRACEREFEPTLESFRCPACGQADVEMTGGHDILLKSVVCETADEAAAS